LYFRGMIWIFGIKPLMLKFCGFLSFIACFVCTQLFCQHESTTKYTSAQRKNVFPFKAATQIKIASFGIKALTGNVTRDAVARVPVTGDVVDTERLDQLVSITGAQADTLSDILLNSCYKWPDSRVSEIRCYVPRNAIVFFDARDVPFAFIEICFECRKLRKSNDDVFLDEKICDRTYDDLQTFFRRMHVLTSEFDE